MLDKAFEKNSKTETLERDRTKARLVAVSASFLVGASLMAVKFYAYRLTASSAILSDALESIINVVASAFALVSVLIAAKPPDPSHPYGHGKIEYFSAGFEGALIILAAIGIFRAGWSHIIQPQELARLQLGVILLVGASLVNLVLAISLIRVGKRTHSLILIADGKHVLTDVYTSGGVLLGLLFVHATGWYWLDGAIACLVGLNILVMGLKLVRQSFAALMHTSDAELLKEIAVLLGEYRKDTWIDIHQLRAWRSGNLLHIDFHLILPRDLTLEESHREGKEVEEIIKKHFGGAASVLIHLDPCTDADCPVCSRYLCGFRGEELKNQIPWTWNTLISAGVTGERLVIVNKEARKTRR